MKTATIFGVNGQDGSYLAELLLSKGYAVHGVKRRSSSLNTQRIDHLFQDPNETNIPFYLHHGDLTDSTNIINIINKTQPDEIYNLAAQSHVLVSYELPEYTGNVDGLGVLRLLEAIRILKMEKKVRFYQASTSELYGKVLETPQRESTPFNPVSPYAIAKMYAFQMVKNYRLAYGIHASNGILFNHESPRRSENFISRKITLAVARYKLGLQKNIYLGNIDALRDWGHAREYVFGMWLMLQQEEPDDYVLATGKQISVRQFINMAFKEVDIDIEWRGSGLDEKGYHDGKPIIHIDPKYFRPVEVDTLLGDASKAKQVLGWEPTCTVEQLCKEMVRFDLDFISRTELTSSPCHN